MYIFGSVRAHPPLQHQDCHFQQPKHLALAVSTSSILAAHSKAAEALV